MLTKKVERASRIGFIQGVIKGLAIQIKTTPTTRDGVNKALQYLDELFDEHKGDISDGILHNKEGQDTGM